ncbi:aminotransferase class V-fold PLP-dependent enzyme [Actinosynnema pretiosum]|uniref:Cysteine desulfurase n=1 Tax=Actinosynnema pretiosum TaxID=42197 RepID=A0A290Z6F8_9PSEU|nr:aminotransferase class V-fold PLP-dependent enzyme [Actinosynnema pretiosum]ATE54586.1 cysteine desulfurase [Actinosynnema pretiosum]
MTVVNRTAHRAPAEEQSPARSRTPLAEVVGADLRVPLVQGGSVRYANLDHAASTPALRAVADHLAEITPYYSSTHRGAGYASQVTTALYEGARATAARFAGARPDDVVVFTRNTTDSLNLLAGCVPEGGRVLVLDTEHHANLLPWRARGHSALPAAPTLAGTVEALERELAGRPAALLAVAGASNVTGEVLPVDELVRIAHRHGARVVVDAAQLAPHRPFGLASSGADYLVFSGHKTYAPYGAGVLVGRRDWLDAAPPHLAGGGAVREVTGSSVRWADAPERHEAGSPNVLGAVALARACEVLTGLFPAAEAREAELRAQLVAGLERVPGARAHRLWPDSRDAIGVVAFDVAGHDSGLVAAYLSAEHGIGVRDGRFCAHPAVARLGLPRAGAVRASFGLGSCPADVDRLLDALALLVERGPSARYELVAGRHVPVPDPRPLPTWLPVGIAAVARPCV